MEGWGDGGREQAGPDHDVPSGQALAPSITPSIAPSLALTQPLFEPRNQSRSRQALSPALALAVILGLGIALHWWYNPLPHLSTDPTISYVQHRGSMAADPRRNAAFKLPLTLTLPPVNTYEPHFPALTLTLIDPRIDAHKNCSNPNPNPNPSLNPNANRMHSASLVHTARPDVPGLR